jgi:hypothetical protein
VAVFTTAVSTKRTGTQHASARAVQTSPDLESGFWAGQLVAGASLAQRGTSQPSLIPNPDNPARIAKQDQPTNPNAVTKNKFVKQVISIALYIPL